VVRGEMRFRMGKAHRRRPGDVVLVPPGVPHDFANPGDKTALVRVDIRPALKMEQLFETAVALAQQGRTMLGGIPKPLDLALFTREFEHEVQKAFRPACSSASRSHRLPGSPSAAATISSGRASAAAVRRQGQPPSKGAHRDDPVRRPARTPAVLLARCVGWSIPQPVGFESA
jgi:Cupin domain